MTGALFSVANYVEVRCVSISDSPVKNSDITSNPKYSDRGKRPTALETLNLPPTQSQKPNTFSFEIPNYSVAVKLVLTAHR